jgi:putative transposase
VRAGYEIFFLDESIFALIPYMTRGWFVIGSRPTKKYIQTPYQKTCAFGALGVREVTTKLSPKINGKKYLAFIKRLNKKHKKLCLIIDNARWHLTKKVMNFIKQKKITLVRLPPYSPELNPIEQYWKNVKKWLGTRIWSSFPELIKQLQIAFRKKALLPNISDY